MVVTLWPEGKRREIKKIIIFERFLMMKKGRVIEFLPIQPTEINDENCTKSARLKERHQLKHLAV